LARSSQPACQATCFLKKMIQGHAVSLKNGIIFQDSFTEKMATFQDMS
jgi:hypothetical protein